MLLITYVTHRIIMDSGGGHTAGVLYPFGANLTPPIKIGVCIARYGRFKRQIWAFQTPVKIRTPQEPGVSNAVNGVC